MLDNRIAELQQVGFELYHRCEHWKKALLKIKRLTNDPLIHAHIDRELKLDQ